MHKAGFGAHGGRRQTCQERLLELSRDAPAGRQKPLECRGMVIRVLEHASGSVGDIVDAGAAQPSFLQQVGGFLQIAATVFKIGRRAAHLRDETIEDVGNRFARPGLGHRDPDAVDVTQRGGSVDELMMMGVDGQNG